MALKILIIGTNSYLAKNIYDYFTTDSKTHLYFYNRDKNTISDMSNNQLCNSSIPFFDITFYLAAANQKLCQNDAKQAIEHNVDAPINIISKYLRNKIGHLIYFSTIQVYGDNLSGDVDYLTPTQPNNNYAKSKLRAELELSKLSHRLDFQFTVLRLANCFGYYKRTFKAGRDLALNAFCLSAAENSAIKINGNGYAQKSFLHIDIFLKIISQVIDRHQSLQSMYICGAKQSTSILTAAAYIQQSFQLSLGKLIKLDYASSDSQNNKFTLPRLPGFDDCPLPDEITIDTIRQEVIKYYV
jgi:nucleoside-diphosphate-sugar epimerase